MCHSHIVVLAYHSILPSNALLHTLSRRRHPDCQPLALLEAFGQREVPVDELHEPIVNQLDDEVD